MPLGHRTYLAAKAKGDSSMFEKAWCEEIAESHACQDPDGMAKPELVEPKCPLCKAHNLGLAIIPKVFRKPIEHDDEVNTLPETGIAKSDLKDTKWAPAAVLYVNHERNTGSPTGRETYGDGASIVVRERESRLHGEGRQVKWMERI